MKKPYLKLYDRIKGFSVWIVDGGYIRKNIDKEFTNFGQNYRFKFIPKKQLWIDKEYGGDNEAKFYISSMLLMDRLLSKGIKHDKAVEIVNQVERRERTKSKLYNDLSKKCKTKEDILKKIHKKLEKKLPSGLKIWIVNGQLVRDIFFLDFTEGGHGYVYDFVPKDEIWIDDDLRKDERKFVLLHEVHERNLMKKGLSYFPAHRSSSRIEYLCRNSPNKIDKYLERELKKKI
jgi:hypothetical protein